MQVAFAQCPTAAAQEVPGLNHVTDRFFHEKSVLWAQTAHLLQCLGQLSLPPTVER